MRWQATVLLIFHIILLACFIASKPTADQQAIKIGFICFSAIAISLTISLGVA